MTAEGAGGPNSPGVMHSPVPSPGNTPRQREDQMCWRNGWCQWPREPETREPEAKDGGK